MPTAPVYRRRRITVAVAVLTVLTVLALLGANLLRGPEATRQVSGSPAPTPVLPAAGNPAPVLPADVGGEPLPDPAVLAGLLGPELSDVRFGGPISGRIADPASGDVLFAQASDRLVVPASTLKLATALAVELSVEPGLRLATTVLAGPAPGQIVLVGGGDVTLSSAPEGNAYAGAATISDLAAQVSAAIPGPVTAISVDIDYFTGPATGPGWGVGDAPSSYAAPITAVMVDGGRFGPRDPGLRSSLPALQAGQALAEALGVPDVPVAGGNAGSGAAVLGQVQSAPVERLVEQMLAASDNVLAEALARQVALAAGAPASFEGAADAVLAALEQAGLSTAGAAVVDGSGLSPRNLMTADLLTEILVRAAGAPTAPGRGLLAGLPVAGYDGTLSERFLASSAVGVLRAKTGTLDGTSALAGVVETADGRLLVFAFVADAVPVGGRYPAEEALDELASVLAGCGCR
ncbi:hypothetical protein BH18ACT7_BH18ACT7_01600 [soil metagenome]